MATILNLSDTNLPYNAVMAHHVLTDYGRIERAMTYILDDPHTRHHLKIERDNESTWAEIEGVDSKDDRIHNPSTVDLLTVAIAMLYYVNYESVRDAWDRLPTDDRDAIIAFVQIYI